MASLDIEAGRERRPWSPRGVEKKKALRTIRPRVRLRTSEPSFTRLPAGGGPSPDTTREGEGERRGKQSGGGNNKGGVGVRAGGRDRDGHRRIASRTSRERRESSGRLGLY
uniref:Uncharacterized protein n=1 Tax=Sphaerodactylus townsendi TaxID=933632 RepID=A0ACB8E4B8_9SAUR